MFYDVCGCRFCVENEPTRSDEKEQLRANGAIVLDTPRIFSDFELIDHLGQDFSKERFLGKWSMVFLVLLGVQIFAQLHYLC